jgi:hypothetical protein
MYLALRNFAGGFEDAPIRRCWAMTHQTKCKTLRFKLLVRASRMS